ncbi:MAG TPA: hypothetical protein VGQ26_18825, partial [Streptosporangiaceae bacterium]|nr:hypothetical protein [Streptosporangiaceae bacterium]
MSARLRLVLGLGQRLAVGAGCHGGIVSVGSLQLPGTGGPVQAFRVTGTGPRRSPIEGLGARPLSRFVGREPEMRALRDVLGQVAVAPE